MVNNRLRFMGMACALAAALLGGLLTGCNNQTEAPATVAGFTSLEDLEGHSVAVINGSTSDVLLSDTNNFAHIRLVRCETPTELFAAISDSVADCGIIDTVVLTTLGMAEHGLAVDFNLPGGFDVAVAFNPGTRSSASSSTTFWYRSSPTARLTRCSAGGARSGWTR